MEGQSLFSVEEKMLHKKRILFFGILMVLLFGLVIRYVILKSEKKTYSSLSERARTYIALQKQREDTFWGGVNFAERGGDSSKVLGVSRVQKEHCFSFEIPLTLRRENKEGACTFEYLLSDQNGFIVLSAQDTPETDINQISAIQFRRLKQEIYRESQRTTRDYVYYIFTNKSQPYEAVAFSLTRGKLLTISMVSSTNKDLDSQFLQLIDSVNLLY